MKKAFYILVFVWCAINVVFTVSCNKTPTYEELKAAENKIIRKIINEKKIEVLDEYPENGVFKENQFVQLSTGIYLNVVDSGTGKRAEYGITDLLVRVSGEYYAKTSDGKRDTALAFSTFSNSAYPFEFRYGNAYGVVQANAYTDNFYYAFISMGLESILSYVGDSAVVKLIIPGYSEVSGAPGSSSMQSSNSNSYVPIYYDRVRYIFY